MRRIVAEPCAASSSSTSRDAKISHQPREAGVEEGRTHLVGIGDAIGGARAAIEFQPALSRLGHRRDTILANAEEAQHLLHDLIRCHVVVFESEYVLGLGEDERVLDLDVTFLDRMKIIDQRADRHGQPRFGGNALPLAVPYCAEASRNEIYCSRMLSRHRKIFFHCGRAAK